MNKAIFRLSLCLFALGISNLSIQKVNADTLKDSSEVKDFSSSQEPAVANDTVDVAETGESDGEPEKATNSVSETNDQIPRLNNALTDNIGTAPSIISKESRSGTVVNSQWGLVSALENGATHIVLGSSFTINNQITYTNNFTIDGGGNTLSFTGSGQLFNGSATNYCSITFNNLNIFSTVTSNGGGGVQTSVVNGGDSGTTLTMMGVNYNTTTNCPLVTTGNNSESSYFNLVFSGSNTIKASGNALSGTALLQNVKNITVSNQGSTTIEALGNQSSSVIGFWTGEDAGHELSVATGSTLNITSSKNILFNLTGSLTMNVGQNSIFNYKYQGNGNKNNLVGGENLDVNWNNQITNEVTLKVGENSQTLFSTAGPSASFASAGEFGQGSAYGSINVLATSPDYVQFKSEGNTAAIENKTTVTLKNVADNTGTSGNYILSETPVSSSVEKKTPVAVSKKVNLSSGNYQDIIYHKEKVEEVINLGANYRIGNNISTIKSTLSGAYANYDNFEWLASPKKLTDDEINDASIEAQNDATGLSGYYQSGPIPASGILPNVTNVWANEYYLYAQLSNSSTGKTSPYIECVVSVPEYKFIRPSGAINFVGGYRLSVVSSAKLTNEGNAEVVLQYNNFTANEGSSGDVSLVNSPTEGNKELVLNLTAKNNNSSPSWGPLMLNSNEAFNGQVNLLPYWTGSGNSDANFTVNGSYSGPLGKNQLENVSYNLSMNVYTNN